MNVADADYSFKHCRDLHEYFIHRAFPLTTQGFLMAHIDLVCCSSAYDKTEKVKQLCQVILFMEWF